jgi:mannose-6-phosphate isomerase-like protein (cupin superfamily)
VTKFRSFATTFVASCAAAATLTAAQQPGAPASEPYTPPVVPVHDEPHHRQVFQHGPMRILDLQIPPNDMSWFHLHEWPVLYVTLGTSATRTQMLGGEWSGGAAGGARRGQGRGLGRGAVAPAAGRGADGRGGRAGRGGAPPGSTSPRATSTTSYAEAPITHRLENIGTNLFRAMVVINETQGDETTSSSDAGFDAEPELTNRWFRAYRITVAPDQKTPTHRHRAPVAIVQATPGTGLGEGRVTFEFNEPGQWAFFDAGHEHEVRNAGTGTLELIEVEVRRR